MTIASSSTNAAATRSPITALFNAAAWSRWFTELTASGFLPYYTYDGDLEITKRTIQLSRLLRAKRIIYLSSWVVSLPDGGLDFPYRRAKLECEQMIAREWAGESAVVRVANVIGSPELLQQVLS